ncbi:hypothetical protein [Parasediminibacterium sp. JCM 36343]|uniref:hypothetical protein n=1 Tax=Parasediminibacterium sp. JCM 36343 TaxID=3374279 RepID=UPI003978C5F1
MYTNKLQVQKKGRPKKKNAVKAGELKGTLCRFSFIVEKKIAAQIKVNAKNSGLTIKDFMNKILSSNLGKVEIENNKNKRITGNDAKLKEYLKKE